MKYTVLIEEALSQEFEVEANSPDEAVMIAKRNYREGEFIVQCGIVQNTKLQIVEAAGEKFITEWEDI